jgi:hypothetical protein
MAVRASDYVKRPSSPTAAAKRQRSPMNGGGRGKANGSSSTSCVRWVIAIIAFTVLGVLVWLNLHVKTTTLAEHHISAEGDNADSHKNTHFLHNLFGACIAHCVSMCFRVLLHASVCLCSSLYGSPFTQTNLSFPSRPTSPPLTSHRHRSG